MIRERLLPRLEVAQGMEPDFGEKVLSGAWSLGFCDKATLLERLWIIV